MAAIRIIVSPAKNGRYAAHLGDRLLVSSARTPLLDSARVLLDEGVDPETVLEMQHKGSDIVAMRGQLGKLAALTVAEGEKNGPVFRQYVPFSAVDSPVPRHGGAQDGQIDSPAKPAPQPLARPRLANTRPRLTLQKEAA